MTTLTCYELNRFLTDYLSGEVDDALRLAFDQHLQHCAECVRYLRSYQEAIRLGKAAFADPDAPISEDVPAELVQVILEAWRRG